MTVSHSTPAVDLDPDVSGDAASGEVATGCAVCPHRWNSHDQIGTRYCTATAAGKISRGCVCTGKQTQ